jgi:hypothetical protein
MKKDTYYAKNREKLLDYQKKNPTVCHICQQSYTNKKSHFRNPKYVIQHQAFLSSSLRLAK